MEHLPPRTVRVSLASEVNLASLYIFSSPVFWAQDNDVFLIASKLNLTIAHLHLDMEKKHYLILNLGERFSRKYLS